MRKDLREEWYGTLDANGIPRTCPDHDAPLAQTALSSRPDEMELTVTYECGCRQERRERVPIGLEYWGLGSEP